MAMWIVSKLRKVFAMEISLRCLLDAPTSGRPRQLKHCAGRPKMVARCWVM